MKTTTQHLLLVGWLVDFPFACEWFLLFSGSSDSPADLKADWQPLIVVGVVGAQTLNVKNTHTCAGYVKFNIYIYIHTHKVSLTPPWEDQCEGHRMTRMTGTDCAVMCNLINTHIHTHRHTHTRSLSTSLIFAHCKMISAARSSCSVSSTNECPRIK